MKHGKKAKGKRVGKHPPMPKKMVKHAKEKMGSLEGKQF